MASESILRIRGMVCERCVSVVARDLKQLGIAVVGVQLGEVRLSAPLSAEQKRLVESTLESEGFSLLTDRKAALLMEAKRFITELLDRGNWGERSAPLSTLLSDRLAVDYASISSLFSSTEGITLEKYVILQRLDKARELLVYTDLPLAEIAYRTGFSGAQHLSNRFKQETGLTPVFFRRIRRQKEQFAQVPA